MELLFLGTGAGVPAKLRNVTSIALKLLEERGAVWLFDCGEATQHQILHTSLKPRRIEKIFITHLHGDHIYGLPGLLGSRSFQGGESELTVYGPKGIKEYIEVSLSVSRTHLQYPLEVKEIGEGVIFEDDGFIVEAMALDHALPTFGYRVVEKDKSGVLQVDRLRENGVPPGPLYKKLKAGEKVTLEDGMEIDGMDFLGPTIPGRVVTVLGDTRVCSSAVELGKDADVLVHEATFNRDQVEMAREYFHSTTKQAGETALQAGAKRLFLTHISSRYAKESWGELEKEAREVFPETYMANDFMEYIIPVKK
ncbi:MULTISPECIES: ribonuclease Z [Bacillaceae]|uniref:ribonuclease Z n=1 Tax=Bacillaceae TaxID=186817 RepID=UPI001C560CD7|nr:ribonuclease Z [Rossellomorea sp. YZS02]MBW3113427.1 ribonuclease Z [Bacillus sp. MCCB 382]MDX8344879.1 ribonuclease Z [Rossellomorea sp. YZS02]